MNTTGIYQLERQKLSGILNSFSDAILFESSERVVEFVNEKFCSVFKIKFAPDVIIGSNYEDGVIASSFLFKNPSRFIYRIEELIESGNPCSGEEIFLRDGRSLIRDYSPVIVNNKITGHLWVYKEITISTSTNLQNSGFNNAFFEQIVNNLPSPIVVFNSEKEYLFVNKAAINDDEKRMFIMGKTEVQYNQHYNIPTPESIVKSNCFSNTLINGILTQFEESVINEYGKFVHYKTFFFPIRSFNNSIDKIVSYSIDITEQKAILSGFQQLITQYQNALNRVKDLVIIANDNLEVSFLNDAFKNLYSIELINDTFEGNMFAHIPIKEYSFYSHLFGLLAGKNNNIDGRLNLAEKNNKKNWLNYNISKVAVNNENKQSSIVAVFNDITSEVAVEENLLEVVKREKELNELKSAFVNMVSHEMRTPLAIISSCAEIIQMMLANDKPKEEIDNYANHILSEVERMTTFMNDILMISKIEAGKIEFNPEEVSLIEFVNSIVNSSYSPWKDNRHLEVEVKGRERLFPFDAKMVRHILQNLIDNAFKYSSQNKSPKLRLRYSKTYITFSIVDFGIGIYKEDIAKLFTSFSRGSNVANIPGTGIGLVVVKYFVNQHNGSVSIKSKVNNGTIFSIKIPY